MLVPSVGRILLTPIKHLICLGKITVCIHFYHNNLEELYETGDTKV